MAFGDEITLPLLMTLKIRHPIMLIGQGTWPKRDWHWLAGVCWNWHKRDRWFHGSFCFIFAGAICTAIIGFIHIVSAVGACKADAMSFSACILKALPLRAMARTYAERAQQRCIIWYFRKVLAFLHFFRLLGFFLGGGVVFGFFFLLFSFVSVLLVRRFGRPDVDTSRWTRLSLNQKTQTMVKK